MKFVSNNNITNPTINLAMEEYVLKHSPADDSYFLFYVNEPSIIVGKNQSTIEEVNKQYIDDHHIHVVRRIFGGGAVYHDKGNLNFSFVTSDDGNSFHNFKEFAEPIVQALQPMGVNAGMTDRNDVQVGAAKISGNAMVKVRNRMLSHGILMLNSDSEGVRNALKVNPKRIQSKGVKSVRKHVADIEEFLDDSTTIDQFKQIILKTIFGEHEAEEYHLTKEDWNSIKQLSNGKYHTWDWNYGKDPKYDFERDEKFEKGFIQAKFDVKKGKIEHAKVFDDFFRERNINELEDALVGILYDYTHIEEVMEDYDFYHYSGDIDKDSILKLMAY